jgi:hypothetical protein
LSYAPIESVTRTKFIGVTALSGAAACGLRTILDSEPPRRRLPDPPEALLGSLVHRAIEERGHLGADAVSEQLLKALEGSAGVYPSDASASGQFDLIEILGASRISAKLAAARRITETIAIKPRRAKSVGRTAGTGEKRHPLPTGDWNEESMSSEELQLGGRLDLLRVTVGQCSLIDFKSGRALEADDSLKETYADQLHLYALLARACGYTSPLRMEIVASDGRFRVAESDARTSRLRSDLKALVNAAPIGAERNARELARFSAGCATCRIRPWCGTYLESAPTSWLVKRPSLEVPYDTWGHVEIVRLAPSEEAFSSVVLRDAANRLVSVTGVPTRISKSLSSGMRTGFFGLRPKTTGRGHPQNFVLADPGNTSASALSALVLEM